MEIITDTLKIAVVISMPIIAVLSGIIGLYIYDNHNKPTKKHWEIRK